MKLLAAIAAVVAVVLAVCAPAQAQTPARRALILLERPGPLARPRAAASATALASRHDLRRAGPSVPEVGVVTVAVPAAESFSKFARRLRRDPAVAAVEPDVPRTARLLPADPGIVNPDPSFIQIPGADPVPYQWYLRREGFPQAWDQSRGDGVVVAVIDSGVDDTHPELQGKINAVRDQDAGSPNTQDQVGHGTHVAGLACGATNNQSGIASAGFDCRLLIEKSDLTSASVIASVVDAVNRGAKVINMSFGGGRESLGEMRAISYAWHHDVVLVAAASDTGGVENGHPAKDLQATGTGNHLDVGRGLVVTAADGSNRRASFAGRGSQISLAAFGDTDADGPPGIFSTFPAATTLIETGQTAPAVSPCYFCRTTLEGDRRYAYLAGTSMAAPQVAGAAALVRSANPRLSNASVIRVLKLTAGGSGSWNPDLGWGILDAGRAVSAARALTADTVAPATRRTGRRVRSTSRTFTLRWRGRDTAAAGVIPAGVESYKIYVREGRGGHARSIENTSHRSETFVGSRGRRYSFWIQARDRAGNVEARGAAPDYVVRVRRK